MSIMGYKTEFIQMTYLNEFESQILQKKDYLIQEFYVINENPEMLLLTSNNI